MNCLFSCRMPARLTRCILAVAFAAMALPSAAALAQTPDTAAAPSAGSPDTLINGRPAQRAGDQAQTGGEAKPAAPETSPNVLINGKPAVTGGNCPGGVPITSPNVFINGKPAVIGCSK
jgi:uncharacterized Zn-binding protein involved in type VI secretion